jgi:hypothetical protein
LVFKNILLHFKYIKLSLINYLLRFHVLITTTCLGHYKFFDEGTLLLITFSNPIWIMDIKMSYELDIEVQNCIIEKLGNKFTNSKNSMRSGLLLYIGRIMVAIWSLLQLKY